MTSPNPIATIVLGMHRSGTSLVSRCLGLLGVALGPEEHLLAPGEFNPTGFWEHKAVVKLNDEVLSIFGGTWSALPELPAGWENDPRLAELRGKAASFIAAEFGDFASWGFKDPRTCVTLPFWKSLLPEPRYVLCLRSPADVAHSLEHAMAFDEGVALWAAYVEASLRHTAGEKRATVFYDDLLADPAGELRRIAAELGIPASDEALKAAGDFTKLELRHHRTDVAALMADSRVPFAAKALYAALRGGAPEPLAAAALATLPTSRPRPRTIVRQMRDILETKVTPSSHEIAPGDWMYRTDGARYFEWGEWAVRCIHQAMFAACKPGAADILDLPCGHGRALRFLKNAFRGARLTACDLDADGVEFCARTFGATPVVSRPDIREVQFPGKYDLIWCGSLLTHIRAEQVAEFLAAFESLLVPGGIVVFTTHGRWIADRLRRGTLNVGLPEAEIPCLLEDYDATGFGYRDYPKSPGYGVSLSSPSWICAQLEKRPLLRQVMFQERGWFYHQDAIGCVRIEEGT